MPRVTGWRPGDSLASDLLRNVIYDPNPGPTDPEAWYADFEGFEAVEPTEEQPTEGQPTDLDVLHLFCNTSEQAVLNRLYMSAPLYPLRDDIARWPPFRNLSLSIVLARTETLVHALSDNALDEDRVIASPGWLDRLASTQRRYVHTLSSLQAATLFPLATSTVWGSTAGLGHPALEQFRTRLCDLSEPYVAHVS